MRLGATRTAIHDALAWGWHQKQSGLAEFLEYFTQIEKTHKPDNSAADMLEAAYICAAVESQDVPIGDWLRFAYSPESSQNLQLSLSYHLRKLFSTNTVKKHKRICALAETAIEDYRFRLRRCRDFPVIVYAERMDIIPDHWVRDWKWKKDRFDQLIQGWDRIGVGQVSRMVKCLNGQNEDDTPTTLLGEFQGLQMASKYA